MIYIYIKIFINLKKFYKKNGKKNLFKIYIKSN